jgi:hypothetical protein
VASLTTSAPFVDLTQGVGQYDGNTTLQTWTQPAGHDLPTKTSPLGNGTTSDDQAGVQLTHGGLDGTLGADEVVPLPIERAQFTPPASGEETRSIRVRGKRLTGCDASSGVRLSSWRVWVVRYQAE